MQWKRPDGLSLLLAATVVMAFGATAQAELYFSDDFDDADSTQLDGKAPDVGGAVWDQTAGALMTVQSGAIETTGDARVVFGFLTDALSINQTLVFDFDTNDPSGNNFHSGGYAGFALFVGGTEGVFIGDLSGASTTWGINEPGGIGNVSSSVAGGDQNNGRFVYEYNSGNYELQFNGVLALGGTMAPGKAIDRVRISNANFGDVAVDSMQINVTEIAVGPKFGTVFSDDFDDPNGTVLDGKAPDAGVIWDQTAGPPVTIQDGAIDTTGSGRTAFGVFDATLSAGQTLVLDFDTDDVPDNNFHSAGFAGISLFDGTDELIFIGDLGNGDALSPWGISEVGGAGDILTDVFETNQDQGRFAYDFDTGNYELSFGGVVALADTFGAGKAIDRIRFINGGGGDIKISYLNVDFVAAIPEPTTAALLGVGVIGMLRRRRSTRTTRDA